MASGANELQSVKPQLGLWDAVSIIVGIVIGSSIYTTPPTIFSNVASPLEGLGVWLLCGVLSLIGALCYAELATTYPRSGGDYVYLTRAFGGWVGFLFGWAQIAVILSGSTGAMAFIFGEYAADLVGVAKDAKPGFTVVAAAIAVIVLSLINILGVVLGKWVQNLLVLTKILGLGAIVVIGFLYAQPDAWKVAEPVKGPGFGLAMILVLYAYGGWNDAAFVAADVRDQRNIPRALILGTLLITVIYLLVNSAYILGLGFESARQWRPTIASDLMKAHIGDRGALLMNILVMISALGAMNGLIFTGSRIYSSIGAEHSVFALLGRWSPTFKSPLWALLTQAVIALLMIGAVGSEAGRSAIDGVLKAIGAKPVPWGDYFGGFNTLFAGTAPVFWTFFLLTGLSLFVLRFKDRHIVRPFRLPIPAFPVLPLIFCGMCVYGLYAASTYAKWVSLIGLVPLAFGIPLYFISTRTPTHAISGPADALGPALGVNASTEAIRSTEGAVQAPSEPPS